MNSLSDVLERLRGLDPERMLGLRPAYPAVALQIERDEAALVRLRRRRGRRPLLEAHAVRRLEGVGLPTSIFDNGAAPAEGLAERLRELFEASSTRPGRVSLVLPDSLAKVSLLTLPERPPSRRQLEQLIRFKMRRAVPFKLDDAGLSYQIVPGEGPGLTVLVALVRRSTLDLYEQALEALGARPGLVDLCTPNLLNLCRAEVEAAAAAAGGDVALLNCAPSYFSLLIVRGGRLIFFRCKSWAVGQEAPGEVNGVLARELASSFSYYQEKLDGERVRAVLVRSVERTTEELAARLAELGVDRVQAIDPAASVELARGATLGREQGQRIAPAVGAAAGRR